MAKEDPWKGTIFTETLLDLMENRGLNRTGLAQTLRQSKNSLHYDMNPYVTNLFHVLGLANCFERIPLVFFEKGKPIVENGKGRLNPRNLLEYVNGVLGEGYSFRTRVIDMEKVANEKGFIPCYLMHDIFSL